MLYLLDNEFELVTDHKPLDYILNRPDSKPTPRFERWALRLPSFEFKVVYIKGNSNVVGPLFKLSLNSKFPASVIVVMKIPEAHAVCVAKSAVPIVMKWEIRDAFLECVKKTHTSLSADTYAVNKAKTKHYADAKAKAKKSKIFEGN